MLESKFGRKVSPRGNSELEQQVKPIRRGRRESRGGPLKYGPNLKRTLIGEGIGTEQKGGELCGPAGTRAQENKMGPK